MPEKLEDNNSKYSSSKNKELTHSDTKNDGTHNKTASNSKRTFGAEKKMEVFSRTESNGNSIIPKKQTRDNDDLSKTHERNKTGDMRSGFNEKSDQEFFDLEDAKSMDNIGMISPDSYVHPEKVKIKSCIPGIFTLEVNKVLSIRDIEQANIEDNNLLGAKKNLDGHHKSSSKVRKSRKSMCITINNNLKVNDQNINADTFFSPKSANFIEVFNQHNYKEDDPIIKINEESVKQTLSLRHHMDDESIIGASRRSFVRLDSRERKKVKKS